MIVSEMERLSQSPELCLPNQRSVIAKSVSNQVVPVDIRLSHEMYESSPERPPLSMSPPLPYQNIQVVVPNRTQPAYMEPESPPDPTMLASANYDLFCEYELLKTNGKRKAIIQVPSENKDEA